MWALKLIEVVSWIGAVLLTALLGTFFGGVVGLVVVLLTGSVWFLLIGAVLGAIIGGVGVALVMFVFNAASGAVIDTVIPGPAVDGGVTPLYDEEGAEYGYRSHADGLDYIYVDYEGSARGNYPTEA